MYKILKDSERIGKYTVKYFMDNDSTKILYEMLNLTWEDVSKLVKNTVQDRTDLVWMYDLIRLSNKQVNLNDSGKWSVL